jgi:hypothetical protein
MIVFEFELKTGKKQQKFTVTQSFLGMQLLRKGVEGGDLSTGLDFRQRLPRNSRAQNYRGNLS